MNIWINNILKKTEDGPAALLDVVERALDGRLHCHGAAHHRLLGVFRGWGVGC